MKSAEWGLRGLVLDVDDTLFLERTYVASGFRSVGAWLIETHGVHRLSEVALALFEAGVRGDIFDRALIELGLQPSQALLAELVGRYRAHQPDIQLLPDARALIDSAAEQGIPMAVITDGPSQSQRAKITALGIESACDVTIVTSDHVGVLPKPDPSAFLLVQERWGLESASLVYIGDNPTKDFVAPHRLGWRTIRVRRPQSLHEAVPSDSDVDHETRDLRESARIMGI